MKKLFALLAVLGFMAAAPAWAGSDPAPGNSGDNGNSVSGSEGNQGQGEGAGNAGGERSNNGAEGIGSDGTAPGQTDDAKGNAPGQNKGY